MLPVPVRLDWSALTDRAVLKIVEMERSVSTERDVLNRFVLSRVRMMLIMTADASADSDSSKSKTSAAILSV